MIEFVEPGTVLGKTIYDSSGRPLLKQGTHLNSSYLKRLKAIGYTTIYTDDPLTYDIVVDDYVPEELKSALMAEIRVAFKKFRETNSIQNVLTGSAANRITELMKNVLDSIRGNELFDLHMGSILNKDESLYSHSFHVGLFSTIIAIAKNLEEARIREIGIGALLHDIGKVTIPDTILNKPGKLTSEEWERIKTHPTVGYDIIRKQYDFSIVSAHCAYQHHERPDGTGYPRGLKEESIHTVGRITAVADVFEAMTAIRPYKRPILPTEALEYLYANCGNQFDAEYVQLFREHVALYPVGVTVTLSDQRQGIVVQNLPYQTQRPVVRIFAHGKERVSPYDVDLSQTLNVTICDFHLNGLLRGDFENH